MKILLFDMDGVLLESHGYHLALQETVRRMALALGFWDASLSSNDIAAFEAGGITSEWDVAAISTALLLETAWRDEPGLGLPNSLDPNSANAIGSILSLQRQLQPLRYRYWGTARRLRRARGCAYSETFGCVC
jgi:FMN phosphatase YigB (HAD superfamily)